MDYENWTAMYQSLDQCRVVVIGDELVGIAPEQAVISDLVYTVNGGTQACILRPAPNNMFRLISGDCYVEHMDGTRLESMLDEKDTYFEGCELEKLIIC